VFFIVTGSLVIVLDGIYKFIPLSLSLYLLYCRYFTEPEFPTITLKDSDTQKDFFWQNSIGRSYFSRIFYCKDPKGVIYFFHGMNNYIDKSNIDSMAKTLTNRGYIFVTYDQEGFGKSAATTTKRLGYVESWEHLVTDAEEFITHIHQKYQLPFFTYGISMGGAVCLLLSLKMKGKSGIWKNYRGMCLLAPAILNTIEPHWIIVEILRLVNWLGGDWLRWGPVGTDKGWKEMIPHRSPSDWPWRGEECIRNELELRESKWSAYPKRLITGTGYQLLQMTKYLESKLPEIASPFICIHGRGDAIVPPHSSELIQKKCQSSDKTVVFYDKMCHAIPCDILWPQIELQIVDWIEKRI